MDTQKPKVVVAMIVKNEEELLSRCLDSVKGTDFLYIADTGSEDKTIEIAKRYTDKVFDDYKWNDSFCEARNYILNKVKEDFKGQNVYVLSIDADEYAVVSFDKIREAVNEMEKRGALAADVKLVAEGDGQMHYYPRLFKMDDKVWWEGVAHNHISVPASFTSEVEIIYGYSPAHLRNPNRTLDILTKEVEKTGNARETFYLGREYWYRAEFKKCAEIMEDYVKKAHFLPEKADAYLILARCYWAMGMGEVARENCMKAIVINPHFKEAVIFMSKLAGRNSGNPIWERNADFWEKASANADNSNVLFVRN